MAEDVVILKFQGEIGDLKSKLAEIEAEVRKISATQTESAADQKKSSAELTTASQKRTAALRAEESELKKLQTGLKAAFTAPEIEKFNTAISKSKNNISLLKGESDKLKAGNEKLSASFEGIAESIGAAFTVERIFEFGIETVKSFREAQDAALKLEFAVKTIGGEGQIALDKLNESASHFSNISIFSEKQLKESITALSTFGLTSDEIEKLLPNLVGMASANRDLAGSTDTFLRAIEGQTRGLKTVGSDFKDTGTKVGNFNLLIEKTAKLVGETSVAFESSSEQAAHFANEAEKADEIVGKSLDDLFLKVSAFKTAFFQTVASVFGSGSIDTKIMLQALHSFTDEQIELIEKSGFRVKTLFGVITKEGKDTVHLLSEFAEGVNKTVDEFDPKKAGEFAKTIQFLNDELRKQSVSTEIGRSKFFLLQKAIEDVTEKQDGLNKSIKNSNSLASQDAAEAAEKARIQREKDAKKAEEDLIKEQNRIREAISKSNDLIQSDAVKQVAENSKDLSKQNKEIQDNQAKDKERELERELQAQKEFEDEKTKLEKEAEEKRKKLREEVRDESIKLAGQILDSIFTVQENNLKRTQDAETQALEDSKDKTLSNKRLTEAQKEEINKEFAAKELALKKKQFEETKRLSELEAIIKGALAVVTALASSPPPYNYVLAAAVAAAAAIEIATIASQKFAKGKRQDQKGGVSLVGEQGMETMFVPDNAMIVDANKTRRHKALINAMMDGNLDDYLEKSFILPRLQTHIKNFEEAKEKSFSNNLGKSLIYYGITATQMEKNRKKGIVINNADEIISGIVSGLSNGYDIRRKI